MTGNKVLLLYGDLANKHVPDAGFLTDIKRIRSTFNCIGEDGSYEELQVSNIPSDEIVDKITKIREEFNKIFIYYAGHGFNDEIGSFPSFETGDGRIQLSDIHDLCIDLKFELSVVGSDCCNVVHKHHACVRSTVPRGDDEETVEVMFTAEGHLLFSAASKGEHSNGVGDDFPEPGGFFTTAFFTCFDGNWIDSLFSAQKRVHHRISLLNQVRNNSIKPQTAQWLTKNFSQPSFEM